MSTDLVIARLGSALAALGEAKTIQDTKAILDVATAAGIYAKRQKLSEENIAFAQEVKMEALRQLGELLKATPKNTGAQGRFAGGSQSEPPVATLAEQGIDKKTSMTAQRLADLPPEKFQAVKSGEMSLSKATAKPKPEAPKPSVLEPDDDIIENVVPAKPEVEQEPFDQEQLKADVALVYAEADDRMRQLIDENNRLRAANRALKSQVDEYMNKFNHTVSELKMWKRKAEKLEKAAF